MKNSELIAPWEQIRILHEWYHHLAVSTEALRRLSVQTGLFDQLTALEKAVSKETSQIHADTLRLIDDTIRKLMGA